MEIESPWVSDLCLMILIWHVVRRRRRRRSFSTRTCSKTDGTRQVASPGKGVAGLLMIQVTLLEDCGKRFGDLRTQPLLERGTKFTQLFLVGITGRPNLLSRGASPSQELHILMLQLAAIAIATLPQDIMVDPKVTVRECRCGNFYC